MMSIPRVVLLSLLLALPLSGRAADNSELEKRFAEANARLDAGEFGPAMEIYNEILEAEPTAGNVWVMRALAKWSLKDMSGARADLAQAIALQPDNLDVYRVRGQLRYEAKDYPNSLADFTKAIDLLRANIKVIASNDEDLANAYEKEHAELFGMRAEVENKLNDHPSAIYDLTRAIELKPDYVAAYFLRGQLYEAGEEAAAADADYSTVIQLSPTHAGALSNRAWLRFYAKKWEDAIADGKAAEVITPKSAIVARVVGYAQFGAGRPADAAAMLAKAADLAGDDTAQLAYALFIRQLALRRTGATDDRLAVALAGWKDQPWLTAIGRYLCGQLSEDELDAAMEQGDEADRAGRECEGNFYIGMIRLLAGDRPAARLRFKAAVGTAMTSYIEYTLAEAELARLKS